MILVLNLWPRFASVKSHTLITRVHLFSTLTSCCVVTVKWEQWHITSTVKW